MVVQDDGDHVCFLFVSSIRSGMSRLDMPHWIMMSPFARGLEAIASGFSLRFPEDEENLAQQFDVYDALYAWCRLQVARQ
jgi:hypothetical protein